MRPVFLLLLLLLLAACSTGGGVQSSGITPAILSLSADSSVKGKTFTWGGKVLSVKNLKDRTLVEVMAYPLNKKGAPDADGSTQGRFIAEYSGFLEPAEYPQGQLITVTGRMLGYVDGKVGAADYRFPVLHMGEIRRWPGAYSYESRDKPRVNLGIGFDSSGYRGIGIGIGF
ncbi:Slp family lipoprotein [Thiolapillus sp.]